MSVPNPKGRIAIIADDEDLGRLLLAESVAAVGLESLAFDDGPEALAAALTHEVAIVLLDVDMPSLDGNEVCRRLRAEARFSSVPIVIVTGHQDSEAVRSAFEAGATDFISKPVARYSFARLTLTSKVALIRLNRACCQPSWASSTSMLVPTPA